MLRFSRTKFSSAAAAVSVAAALSDHCDEVVLSAVCVLVEPVESADVDPQAAREATIAVDRSNDRTFFFIKMFPPIFKILGFENKM